MRDFLHCSAFSKGYNKSLLLGKKYDKPHSVLKSRDITLPTKVRPVKAMVFPVVMYGCVSWTMGDGEGQGSLACCSPWGCKELDTTEQLDNNKI